MHHGTITPCTTLTISWLKLFEEGNIVLTELRELSENLWALQTTKSTN